MSKFKEGMSLKKKVEILAAGNIRTKAGLAAAISTMGEDSEDFFDRIDKVGIEGEDIMICFLGICKGDLAFANLLFSLESILNAGDLQKAIAAYKVAHPGEDIIRTMMREKIEELKKKLFESLEKTQGPSIERFISEGDPEDFESRGDSIAESLGLISKKKEEKQFNAEEIVLDILTSIKRKP